MKPNQSDYKKFKTVISYIFREMDIDDLEDLGLKLSSILYHADKYHLSKYGRTICNDAYKKESKYIHSLTLEYHVDMYNSFEEIDFDCLSESDIDALDITISRHEIAGYGKFFRTNKNENSYRKTMNGKLLIWKDIILLDIPNGKDVWDYLNS